MDVGDLGPDPMAAFERWHRDAGTDAVTLATVSPEGEPAARMVLLKSTDDAGLTFHTNYGSAKARELEANPRAALVCFYPPDRQVRVTGDVVRLSPELSDEYWATRPRASQLGAWASPQSEVLSDRSELERRLAEVMERFAGHDVPRPEFWGGYRLAPATMEFWTHRDDRLHDRIRYRRVAGEWIAERLAP